MSQYAIERSKDASIILKEEEKSSFSLGNTLASRIYMCILCILYTIYICQDMPAATPLTYPLFESVPA